jgi:hypothetical protein
MYRIEIPCRQRHVAVPIIVAAPRRDSGHRDHRRSSAIIGDHRWSSAIIGDHRWSSAIIGDHRWSSAIIGGHRRSSVVIGVGPKHSLPGILV